MKKAFTILSFVCLLLAWPAFAAELPARTHSVLDLPLQKLVTPTREIPFKEVIQTTTGHRIIDFDTNNPAHLALRDKILEAAELATTNAIKDGLFAGRVNEAGNHMEKFVRAALHDVGLTARIPVNSAGRAQATGYPDIEIQGNTLCYLELKTYSAHTENTTQRSFYYSPSEHPKVTHDALHLLLAYQLEQTNRDGKTDFVPVHWKLITLQDLSVELKFEFNQSNRELYGKNTEKALLGEAMVPQPSDLEK